MSQKKTPPAISFIVWITLKNHDSNNFWYTTSLRHLTVENKNLSTSPINCCCRILQRVKCDFETILHSNFDCSADFKNFQSHNIYRPKEQWKMSPTSLHYSQCSKCTDRTRVCTCHYSISSSTMHCCIAVHLWNRCCCNSGSMTSPWTLSKLVKCHSSQF